jgi:hypothetical protein
MSSPSATLPPSGSLGVGPATGRRVSQRRPMSIYATNHPSRLAKPPREIHRDNPLSLPLFLAFLAVLVALPIYVGPSIQRFVEANVPIWILAPVGALVLIIEIAALVVVVNIRKWQPWALRG